MKHIRTVMSSLPERPTLARRIKFINLSEEANVNTVICVNVVVPMEAILAAIQPRGQQPSRRVL